jgi:hypothetical protein
MDDLDSEWRRKGASLSHKTAREEFGLTQNEIVRIRAGRLHYREGGPNVHCRIGVAVGRKETASGAS